MARCSTGDGNQPYRRLKEMRTLRASFERLCRGSVLLAETFRPLTPWVRLLYFSKARRKISSLPRMEAARTLPELICVWFTTD